MESVFYWAGASLLCGLGVMAVAWVWFLALKQLLKSVRETYLMADFVLWVKMKKRSIDLENE